MPAAAVLVALALAQAPAASATRADDPPPGSASTDAAREAARAAMLDADRLLAGAIQARNLEAFTDHLAGDVIFVSDERPPALGRTAVRKEWAWLSEPGDLLLIREPVVAELSDRGDLGYTRGRSRIFDPSGRSGRTVSVGDAEYLSIWRKDPDGRWRVVVNSSLPASPRPFVASERAPERVLTANLSGELRYELRAKQTGQPGSHYERRVLRVDRRKVDGTWTPLVEAVTIGPAPQP